MLDKSTPGTSLESVISRDDFEIDYSPSPRGSPLKDTSNLQEDQPYLISRHNPNKTYRREAVIASWMVLKKEREQALGKRTIYIDADLYKDYYGRNNVKRCKSERTSGVTRVPIKVKRTYSVCHRYDPNEKRVVKEYKYQLPKDTEMQSTNLQRAYSERYLRPERHPKKVKRSFTTFLDIKTKFLNIFSLKS